MCVRIAALQLGILLHLAVCQFQFLRNSIYEVDSAAEPQQSACKWSEKLLANQSTAFWFPRPPAPASQMLRAFNSIQCLKQAGLAG